MLLSGVSAAAAMAANARRAEQCVVFTNGVFDLLHPGHVRFLQAAAREGDLLIVGINSDTSANSIKGVTRPVVTESERAEVLLALDCVDAVIIFNEIKPNLIIREIVPDVLVKGADWSADQIVGRDTVESTGGRVVRVSIETGYSTTALIERIKRVAR
jgi:D-beta-D-heptose 7-phosphate kinase/D-beta-D-heptose 1-phosphate adenosyltransferase